MAKTRVHELAKKYNLESKVVLEKLQAMGEYVKSPSSTIELPVEKRFEKEYADLLKAAQEAPAPAEDKPAAKKAPAKKAPAKKATTTKAPAKKAATKKTATPETPTRKAADFLERTIDIDGVVPISCGIDRSNYSPVIGPREKNRILFVGRLTGEKHVDVVLHGGDGGPGEAWAARAAVGDRAWLVGPRKGRPFGGIEFAPLPGRSLAAGVRLEF